MDERAWTRILARYRQPSNARGIVEIGITIVPLVVLWALIWATLDLGYWLSLLLAVPAAGFLVRLFMIQHDCGHGSFFRHRLANDWVGRVIGVLTLTPYDFWQRTHALHHASSGNLDRRGFGDIDTLTVREYRALSFWGRLRYRLYRHPAVMFGIGPAYLFVLRHRLPIGLMRGGWRPWLSTMATNFSIALIVGHADLADRHQGVPARPSADHAARGLDRRLAVLRAASVRAHDLGAGCGLEPAPRRVARQLALRPAGDPALVHGQHRHAPRPSPVQPHSRIIGCRARCAIIRSCAASAG